MEDYDARNKALLEQFAEALHNPTSATHFDEDELIEIFDVAGDYGYDYLRMEALFMGARLYPDSQELAERRAVMYADTFGDEALSQYTADIGENATLLSEILELRAKESSQKEALADISRIFRENTSIGDEETIQLVGYAAETDNLKWLGDNLDRIVKKVSYAPALLYELGASAIEYGLDRLAIKTLERLVDEMPYDAAYWSLLASSYLNLDMEKEALDAAEMSLAITPSNQNAAKTKAHILAKNNDIQGIDRMLKDTPDNPDVIRAYVTMRLNDALEDNDLRNKLVALLRRAVPQSFDLTSVASPLLILDPHGNDDILDTLWQITGENGTYPDAGIQTWLDWTTDMLNRGCPEAADAIFRTISRNFTIDADDSDTEAALLPLFAEIHLRLRHFDKTIRTIDRLDEIYPLLTPRLHAMRVIARVRLGQFDRAVTDMENFLAADKNPAQAPVNLPGETGYLDLVISMQWVISLYMGLMDELKPSQRKHFDPDSFDPLFLWM
ncbi:MAG: hypothetical protein Q4F07_03810 [Bacteroidales bacterium]|nr:hypothetical protein [Bacteroidales bacterium]